MNINFRFYWSLLLRRSPVMLALLLICSALGVTTAWNLPPTYTTSARLLVEDPQIPIGTLTNESAAEQLQVIEQRLLTRANLLDIANKHRVFIGMRDKTPDEILLEMRKATRIRRQSGRNQATLMSVTFQARTGQIAANVINEYLTIIQQDSSENREQKVGDTLSFFEQEVNRLNADLDLQSAKIVNFKTENAQALPDDLEFRLGRQAFLQERLARSERDFAAAERQREDLVRIFEATGRIQTEQAIELSPEEQRLQALKREMDSARAIFSESNPKIILLQSQIDQLESVVSAQVDTAQLGEVDTSESALLEATLSEINSRMESISEEMADTNKELDALAVSIAATSANAIALAAMQRDYANIQNRYDAAVNSLDEARMDERIVLSSQGQRITVIEGANVPQKPSGPNRPRIAAMGIGAGLGLAVGFFFLLEVLNRTIRRPVEIQNRFGITPIATIPYMESRRERFLRRTFLVLAFLAVLIGVPAGLWYIDTNYLPLELIVERIIDRIGL